MKKRIVVFDTYNKAYTIRERNQAKYETNEARLATLLAKYDAEAERVAADYRAAGEKFHTTAFWQE